MREGWPRIRLGDFLLLRQRPFEPLSGVIYKQVTLAINGRGARLRARVSGDDVKSSRQFVVRSGDLLISKIDARNGAAAVLPDSLDGAIVTADFPAFEIDPRHTVPAFLDLLVRRSEFAALTDTISAGTTNRVRMDLSRFPDLSIELPSLAEQRRIIDLVEAVDAVAGRAQSVAASATTALEAVDMSVVMGVASAPTVALAKIAEVVGGVTKDSKRDAVPNLIEVPYLRVANVQRGWLDLSEMATIKVSESKVASLRLRSGDVVFNEGGDRDKLGRGWVWEGQIDPCIHQNHVLRARLTDTGFDPWFISIWGNGPFGRVWFEENGSQTTNLASVSLSTLRRFPVPAIPIADQQSIAALHLAIRDASWAARAVRERALALRSALLTDLLSGNRDISASYDRFLDGAA